jgi:hypothetical protein
LVTQAASQNRASLLVTRSWGQVLLFSTNSFHISYDATFLKHQPFLPICPMFHFMKDKSSEDKHWKLIQVLTFLLPNSSSEDPIIQNPKLIQLITQREEHEKPPASSYPFCC